jgi:murein DD-endopeptidase MepM/ murein hydrolase activator NlpD
MGSPSKYLIALSLVAPLASAQVPLPAAPTPDGEWSPGAATPAHRPAAGFESAPTPKKASPRDPYTNSLYYKNLTATGTSTLDEDDIHDDDGDSDDHIELHPEFKDGWAFQVTKPFDFAQLNGFSWAYDIPESACVSQSDNDKCRKLTMVVFKPLDYNLVCGIAVHSTTAPYYDANTHKKVLGVYGLTIPAPTGPSDYRFKVSPVRFNNTILFNDNTLAGNSGPGISFITCEPDRSELLKAERKLARAKAHGGTPGDLAKINAEIDTARAKLLNSKLDDVTVYSVMTTSPFFFKQNHAPRPPNLSDISDLPAPMRAAISGGPHLGNLNLAEREDPSTMAIHVRIQRDYSPEPEANKTPDKPTKPEKPAPGAPITRSVPRKISPYSIRWPTYDHETHRSGCFGRRYAPVRGATSLHNGMDIAEEESEPVFAAEEGKVIRSGWLSNCRVGCTQGCGWGVIVQHSPALRTSYCHMQSAPNLHTGQGVHQGDVIGRVGHTGSATGPHLHFVVSYQGKPRNPALYLPDVCGACALRRPRPGTVCAHGGR